MAILVAATACSSGETSSGSSTSVALETTSSAEPGTSTTEEPNATTTTANAGPTTTTTAPRSLGEELVFNPAFDLGDGTPTGWELIAEESGQTVNYVTESGGHHISFFAPVTEGSQWPEARLVREFPVTPHNDYLVTVEVRSSSEGRLYVAVGFRDSDGNEILERGPGEPDITDSDWITVEGEIESPHEAATGYVILALALRPEVTVGDSLFMDIDRVSVKEILD